MTHQLEYLSVAVRRSLGKNTKARGPFARRHT